VWDVCFRHLVGKGASFGDLVEVATRVMHALPPHIERWHQLWAQHFPDREHRRDWVAESDREFGIVRNRHNGYGWWLNCQERYARLRAKYAGFEEEWADFYARWAKECEHPQANAPMPDEMADEFARICFLRDPHEQEEVTHFARPALSEVPSEEELQDLGV
jgi:hypothetical protein